MAVNFAIRIGKVRPKSGGELVPLRVGSDEATTLIKRDARLALADIEKWTDLKGLITVFWDGQGAYGRYISTAVAGNPIPTTLMPSYVHDVILRELIETKVKNQ